MGWGSGSRLAGELVIIAKDVISDETERESFYEQMIASFEDFDCDTLDECLGIDVVYDDVWNRLYPDDEDVYWEEDD